MVGNQSCFRSHFRLQNRPEMAFGTGQSLNASSNRLRNGFGTDLLPHLGSIWLDLVLIWASFGSTCTPTGPIWPRLDLMWPLLVPIWAACGPHWPPFGPHLCPIGRIWGQSKPNLTLSHHFSSCHDMSSCHLGGFQSAFARFRVVHLFANPVGIRARECDFRNRR